MSLLTRKTPIVPIRAVHLDLKGVPPTPQRLLSLLKVVAAAGYNAVLVEWEDQFPWTVDERFRNETVYTPQQVRAFHDEAAKQQIEIIPLVQCLGHMETPLTIADYAPLREVPDHNDVLNPLASGARELVEKMVDDVLKLTTSPRYFHLGGDEAWTFGTHPDTRSYIEKHGKGALYLHHVEPLLDRLIARGIRPILWHDMMLSWDEAALRRLSSKADLMVWGYNGRVDQTNSHHALANFQKLKAAGLTLWGATAYKGATRFDSDLPDFQKHTINAQGFADVAETFDLQGLCATAWSRFATQHMQTEPIDAALDALMNVGAILHDGKPPVGGLTACLEALEEIGERARFEACQKAMQRLTSARQKGWRSVQDVRQQIVTSRMDPRRPAQQTKRRYLANLVQAIAECDVVASETHAAFADLVPRLWLERYLAERIDPLRDEKKELEALIG